MKRKLRLSWRPRPSLVLVAVLVSLLSAGLVLALAAPARLAAQRPEDVFPTVLPLPNGFQPEGIEVGRGTLFYVGSLVTGAIFGGDMRTGTGDILVPPQVGRTAVGLVFDSRTNYLFVAGGPYGDAYVYDAGTGEPVAAYALTDAPFLSTFVNDVEVTRSAAYFTDSFQDVFYRLPLTPDGALPEPAAVEAIELKGDFPFVPGGFNSNGIEAAPDGSWLIVVNSTAGALYRVDPETGDAVEIDLGGAGLPNADGLWLEGHTLYVVQNFLNQISVVELDPGFVTGRVAGAIENTDFRIPTTVAGFGNALYAVNARFDVALPPFFGATPDPSLEFEVVRVLKP